MTWEIALVFLLLVVVLACFVWEKFPPDLTAMTLFLVIVGAHLLPMKTAFSVFSNPAPLVVGAMFVLSAALVKCGVVDRLGCRRRVSGLAAKAGGLWAGFGSERQSRHL